MPSSTAHEGGPMKIPSMLLPLIAICVCSAALASTPFDGTWRLNSQQADQMTFSVEEVGNGALKYTDSAESYTFKPDGSAFTTPQGAIQTYKKIGEGLYTATTRQNGVLMTTETWRLSSDGHRLFIDGKGTRPDGQHFENRFTFIRTSAGTGLAGSWRTEKVESTERNTLTIQSTAHNDVTLMLSAFKATVHGEWNGRDYPLRGPTILAGTTVSVRQTAPETFTLVQKRNARVMGILHFRLAPDARSMVAEIIDHTGREVGKEVWNKQ
jgi:hypothetical protein